MASPVNPVPLPISEKLVKQRNRRKYPDPKQTDPQEDLVSDAYAAYFGQQAASQATATSTVNGVNLDTQTAAIGATDISGGALAAGIYRLSYYLRVEREAGTSSSLTITFDWIDRATTMSVSGVALTDGLVTTFQTGELLIRIDGASPVRYAVAYTSAGAPSLAYGLVVVLERVAA